MIVVNEVILMCGVAVSSRLENEVFESAPNFVAESRHGVSAQPTPNSPHPLRPKRFRYRVSMHRAAPPERAARPANANDLGCRKGYPIGIIRDPA